MYAKGEAARHAVAFCVQGRPVSAQAHDRGRLGAWKNQVRNAAMAAWLKDAAPLTVAVELRITHYAEVRVADMDNLIKPILDAFRGLHTWMTLWRVT
jgi:hypothetical protein